jgi:hypothetical protein
VNGVNGDWWYLDFTPAAGDVLAPGTYSGATRYPFNGNGPGLSVSGNGRGCNELDGSFIVNELRMDGGDLRSLSISFEQHCEHSPNALRGTLSFRAGDTTTPAPWMAPGGPTPLNPPPAAPQAPAAPAPAPQAAPAPQIAPKAVTVADLAIGVARKRVATSARALLTARPAKVKSAAKRLETDLKRYRAAVKAGKPANARALLKAIDRQLAAVRPLLEHSSARDRKRALKKIAAADRALAAAAR